MCGQTYHRDVNTNTGPATRQQQKFQFPCHRIMRRRPCGFFSDRETTRSLTLGSPTAGTLKMSQFSHTARFESKTTNTIGESTRKGLIRVVYAAIKPQLTAN